MNSIVAIVAQGAMASGLASRLKQNGVRVLTYLSGRSEASHARAKSAGMESVSLPELMEAEFLLSVLPPAVALRFAEQISAQLAAAVHKPLYVDCNAVSPATVRTIAQVVERAGADFVDVGIIGLPPREGYAGPRLYASGAQASRLSGLGELGIQVRVLKGSVGDASALKMAYGGITKGMIAVVTAMVLAADRAGLAADLERELAESEPAMRETFARRIPDMLPKAYRWIDEMLQIREFAHADPAASAIYSGAAELYSRIAEDFSGAKRESDALLNFFRS